MTYKDLLVAMAVGYEVSISIAIALGVSSWHRGFHNTSVAGIFGAVAAIAKIRQLDPSTVTNALGLTVSFASGSMQYLSNGSWNKRLHPAKAAHDAFLTIALAEAGTLGAAEPIEGKFGLINAHTDQPITQVNVDDLGKRWDLLDVGLKPYPACRVTHTSIELAALLSQDQSTPVQSIHVVMDPAPWPMVADPTPQKVHPKDVDAQFSAYYQIAATWLHGDQQGWAIYDHIQDPAVQDLCGKITIESKVLDPNNDLVTSMTVKLQGANGEEVREKTLLQPKWQQPERPPQYEEVVTKFKSLTLNTMGEEKAREVIQFVSAPVQTKVGELMMLLASK